MPDALNGLTVIEIAGTSGYYCSKMMAELGAEVILIEPPEGAALRRAGPFIDSIDDGEHSMPFTYFCAGKRSVCLDLTQPAGQQELKDLARGASVLIESGAPGLLAKLGLGAEDLQATNQSLVYTSITPFGQTGPYAHYASDDIVSLALGGMLHLGGYHDGEPLAAHGNQALLAADQFAAVATLMAVEEVERDHKAARQVDVSIQECVVMGMENAVQFYDLEGTVLRRGAGKARWAGTGVYDCADGQIYILLGGFVPKAFRVAAAHWMMEAGVQNAAAMLDQKWDVQSYDMTDEARDTFDACFIPFARARTRGDLYRQGQARRIPICPVNTPADLAADKQLAAREFFVDLYHGASRRTLRAPGAPYRLSATPWHLGASAPRLGEHTRSALAHADAEVRK